MSKSLKKGAIPDKELPYFAGNYKHAANFGMLHLLPENWKLTEDSKSLKSLKTSSAEMAFVHQRF